MIRFGLFILLALSVACSHHDHDQEHGHDHAEDKETHNEESEEHEEHEEVYFQTTLFSNHTEYFIEYPALIKDKEAEFLIHTTKLSNYKPYTKGTIEMKFKGAHASTDKPDVPGIFKLRIKPSVTGSFIISYILKADEFSETITDTIIVFEHEHDTQEYIEENKPTGTIRFTKEQAWKSQFMVLPVNLSPFAAVIPSSGEMLAMPGEKQNVTAKSVGTLLFATKGLVQGSRVRKGQLLFTLSGQDLADNNIGLKFTESRNQYLKSKSEYERQLGLFLDKIVSEKKFTETQARFKTDSAVYFSLSKSVSAKGQHIYAPHNGYLHELNVSEGQYVETGQLLATISTNKVILLRADVSQQYYNQLNLIETANFRPAYSSKTYSIEELNGHVLAKGASVAENNHYMPVYFKVQNDGSLLEGAFAEFYLITKETNTMISAPISSIIEEQGNYYVYIQNTGETYSKREVELGSSNGKKIAILSGLVDGERIVTQGAMLVKTASTSSGIASHNHAH